MKKNILSRIADKSLKNEKLKNAIIIITIALSTCMMLVLALFFADQQEENASDLENRYQVSYEITKQEQFDRLLECPKVEKAGVLKEFATVTEGNNQLVVSYADRNFLELQQYIDQLEGSIPRNSNEILLVKDYLKTKELNIEPGQEISIDIGAGKQSYMVSGILNTESAPGTYMVLVSEEFYQKNSSNTGYFTFVKIKDAQELTKKELIEACNEVKEEIGADDKQMILSSYYFALFDIGKEAQTMTGVCIYLIIIIACIIVIYNIFYISVLNKASEYGKLRTIGASKKQIKKIIHKEGAALWRKAVLLGSIGGCLIGLNIISGGLGFLKIIGIVVGIGILTYVVVCASVLKPGKMASQVSPIVAMKQNQIWEEKSTKMTKKKHRSLSPANLAVISLSRFKKKTMLTIVSLGFCGILLIVGASYLKSISPEEMARATDFPSGMTKIGFPDGIESYEDKELRVLQEKEYLNPTLEEKIKKIKGVRSVSRTQGVTVKGRLGDYDDWMNVDGFTEDDAKEMSRFLLSGKLDYEKMVNGNYIVVRDKDWETIYNWKAVVGDNIEIKDFSGKKQTYEIAAILSTKYNNGGANNFFVPLETLRKLGGSKTMDYTYQFIIDGDEENEAQIESECFETIQDSSALGMTTLSESITHYKGVLKQQTLPIYIIVLLIGIFGILNLINTLITNIITRKRELSLLQTIGLSNQQLRKMLLFESAFYYIGMIAMTLVIGVPLSILLCRILNMSGTFGNVVYHFPMQIMVFYGLCILFILCVLSAVSLRLYHKESLIERIRANN